MENKTVASQNSKHLIAYFLLAYAIAWTIEIPLALAKQGVIQPILPPWFHYLVAYAPLLSALLVTGATQGHQGLKELWDRSHLVGRRLFPRSTRLGCYRDDEFLHCE